MPHPDDDVMTDGSCRHCGDRLSKPFTRRGVNKWYRRHLTNTDCPLAKSGRGEPLSPAELKRRKRRA